MTGRHRHQTGPILGTGRCMSRGVSEQASKTQVPGKRVLWHCKRGHLALSHDDAQMKDVGDALHCGHRIGRSSLLCEFGAVVRPHITYEKDL